MVNSLYGSKINERRVIGYCHYHKCHITSTQLKQKECLKKQCTRLEKYDNHEFWKQRELKKAKKKKGGGCLI